MSNITWKNEAETSYGPSAEAWKPAAAYRFHLLITKDDGVYSAVALNLPGVGSCGSTPEEAIKNVREAASGVLESYRESGEEVPWIDSSDVDIPFGAEQKWIIVNA